MREFMQSVVGFAESTAKDARAALTGGSSLSGPSTDDGVDAKLLEVLSAAQMVADHEGEFTCPDGCIDALRAAVTAYNALTKETT